MKKKIFLYDVDFFVHWGIPEQLEDFNYWTQVFNYHNNGQKENRFDYTNFCCMAGTGERMKQYSNLPKAFLKIGDYPMYEFVMKQFLCKINNLLTVNSIAEKIERTDTLNYNIINLGDQTSSQVETLRKSYPVLKNSNNFFITSVDAYGIFNRNEFLRFVKKCEPDVVLFSFEPTLVQSKMSKHHTFISVYENRVTNIHIKSRSRDEDKGLAGFFWFKNGKIFQELDNLNEDVNHEILIDHFIKYLVHSGSKVLAYHLDHYVHLGTSEEFQEYEFWKSFLSDRNQNIFKPILLNNKP